MIIVKIQGGLGNQIFEYAFGRAVQNEYGGKLLLDISSYKKDQHRDFKLEKFQLNPDIIVDDSGKYNKYYGMKENLFIRIGAHYFPNILLKIGSKAGIYIWDKVDYKKLILKKRKNILLQGYWQSEEYFKNISGKIRDEIKIKDKECLINDEIYEEINRTNAVCVHIRLTDFLSKKNDRFAQCTLAYYLKGVELIKKKVENPRFYIFTDDVKLAQSMFKFGSVPVFYISQKYTDIESFKLMSSCKYFIIANSTFSWWGAYLSEYQQKIVICPEKWFNDNTDIKYLLPKQWIKLSL